MNRARAHTLHIIIDLTSVKLQQYINLEPFSARSFFDLFKYPTPIPTDYNPELTQQPDKDEW